jgi:tetraacyldisaccharide 4'-kinase
MSDSPIEQKNKSPFTPCIANTLPVRTLTRIYSFFVKRRNDRFNKGTQKAYKTKNPVISIGGIRAGGTGKTPSAYLLSKTLLDNHHTVALLSRGYGRPKKEDRIIKPGESFTWREVGDEPAMLKTSLPSLWLGISPNRSEMAQKIESLHTDKMIFILDDGFQHRRIHRDLDIVCLDESVFEDHLIPSGYLREPIDSLDRAQVVFLIGSEQNTFQLQETSSKLKKLHPHLDIYILFQCPVCWVNLVTNQEFSTLPVSSPVALSGIARPERFFALLNDLQISPCASIPYPDHHKYTLNDFYKIQKLYSKDIITTEKDAIRILALLKDICVNIWYIKIRLKFYNDDSLKRFNNRIFSLLS